MSARGCRQALTAATGQLRVDGGSMQSPHVTPFGPREQCGPRLGPGLDRIRPASQQQFDQRHAAPTACPPKRRALQAFVPDVRARPHPAAWSPAPRPRHDRGLNLAGERWAYNFGNPLSGTHFGPGRTFQVRASRRSREFPGSSEISFSSVDYDARRLRSGSKTSSIARLKSRAILNASGRLGSYFPRSSAMMVWRDTSRRSARSPCDHPRSARNAGLQTQAP